MIIKKFHNNYERDENNKNKKTCAYTTPTHVRSSFQDTENSAQRAKLLPGITSSLGCINGLWRGVRKFLPGVPPYGSGGWGWFSISEARSVCGSCVGEHPQWGAPQQPCQGTSGRRQRQRQGWGGRVTYRCHVLLSWAWHMPPKDRRASGEDKE